VGEVVAEVAGGDLSAGPPQRRGAGGGGVAAAAGQVGVQVERCLAGEQQRVQVGAQRWWILDWSAGALGDLVGDVVGLLGGDAALFDGEGGDVSDGVDVRDGGDLSERVGGQEAVRVVGKPGDAFGAESAGRFDGVWDEPSDGVSAASSLPRGGVGGVARPAAGREAVSAPALSRG
jgi:hypothetical protein